MTPEVTEEPYSSVPPPAVRPSGRRTSRFAWFAMRLFTKTALLAVAFVVMVVLNIATLTVPAVFDTLSSAAATVTSRVVGKDMTIRAAQARQVSTLNQKNKALSSQIERTNRAKLKAKHTSRRIAARVVKATTRNTGAVFVEAIPYVGIAAIVGATALELNDACETMKDLHELEMAMDPEWTDGSAAETVCGTKVPTKDEIIAKIMASPSAVWDAAKSTYNDLPDYQISQTIDSGIRYVVRRLNDLLE